MGTPQFLLNIDDSPRKREIVMEACLLVGASREQIWQTEDPDEALQLINDLKVALLGVITDNQIEGHGPIGVQIAETAAHRLGGSKVLGYSTTGFSKLPVGVTQCRASNRHSDIVAIQHWLLEREISFSRAA